MNSINVFNSHQDLGTTFTKKNEHCTCVAMSGAAETGLNTMSVYKLCLQCSFTFESPLSSISN